MSEQQRRAVVSGASRGIGRAVAVELARQGVHVYCLSTRAGGCDDTVAACAEVGGSATGIACDVSDGDAVAAMAEQVLAEGGLDILVNNAGITKDGLFLRMSVEDLDSVLAVNLRGAFMMAKAFARPLTKSKAGRIVNVGSIVGLVGNAGQANYAASKAAMVGFSRSLAKEFGGRGVTVNVVAPGFIETDMTGDLPEAVRSAALADVPLGRLGSSEDIARAVAFLASPSASYITGQVLVVDGGMTL